MEQDFHMSPAEMERLEHRARQMRAEALAYGIRYVRNWTVSAFDLRTRKPANG